MTISSFAYYRHEFHLRLSYAPHMIVITCESYHNKLILFKRELVYNANMAAPITHIVLAEKVFDRYFSGKERAEFMVGTSLPDIRYLGVIDREKTHSFNLRLADLQVLSSFEAGFNFHSLVDEVRENFVVKNGLYGMMPDSKYNVSILKLLEDQILYPKINNWNEISEFFNKVFKGEEELRISVEDLKYWHESIKRYITFEPTEESLRGFMQVLKIPEDTEEEMVRMLKIVKQNQTLISKISQMYEEFESLIS